MHPSSKAGIACLAVLLSVAAAGCGKREVEAPEPRPRPVTIIELAEVDPVGPLQLTGVVQSWKETDVAFEVSGPMAFIVEPGINLEGRWEEGDVVHSEGDVLARIDPSLFEIRVATAQSAVAVAQENLRLAQVQLEVVLPAQVQAALAEKVRAEAEHVRVKAAYERNAMSEIDFIRAEADKDGSTARHTEAVAQVDAKKAEIQALQAQVEEALANLSEAQYNLDRCVLRAPFDAQVSDVRIEAGGYATASAPVAHLIMMDPVQVDIAVSQETAARLQERDRVQLKVPGVDETIEGAVHEKATVADPGTRTFRISLIVRNARRTGMLRIDNEALTLPRVQALSPMFFRSVADRITIGRSMVEETHQLRRDDQGWFVWVADGVSLGDTLDPDRPTAEVRKVRVEPGDTRVNYQGLYVLRSLDDLGGLPQDALLCWDAPEDLEEGTEVLVGEEEWHLLPGQLVQVFLGTDPPRPGFYLPMDAIRARETGGKSVFVVRNGQAHQVPVTLGEAVGDLFRVEPTDRADADLLGTGAEVISRHVHFLVDGEDVRVTGRQEIVP